MLSIGEFSKATQISIKALRLYHDKGILLPDHISFESNYRFYSNRAFEKAVIIKKLKEMDFSLQEIKEIIIECNDDREMIAKVEGKLKSIESRIKQFKVVKENLNLFLTTTQEYKMDKTIKINREKIDESLICGIRFKGKYQDIGRRFKKLFKSAGFNSAGKPFALYYDGEYLEDNADIEACILIKKEIKGPGFTCRKLKGGQAVTLLHQGPYDDLGRSYKAIFEYCRNEKIDFKLPIREEYIKGPGIIFKGNSRKYLTKIIVFLT